VPTLEAPGDPPGDTGTPLPHAQSASTPTVHNPMTEPRNRLIVSILPLHPARSPERVAAVRKEQT
jgi:hypothetical protein